MMRKNNLCLGNRKLVVGYIILLVSLIVIAVIVSSKSNWNILQAAHEQCTIVGSGDGEENSYELTIEAYNSYIDEENNVLFFVENNTIRKVELTNGMISTLMVCNSKYLLSLFII